MKKILVFITVLLLLCGCNVIKTIKTTTVDLTEEDEQNIDYDFVNAYENVGSNFRKVKIDENNPFVYVKMATAKKYMNYKSVYLYFGDERCPWCRSCIESAIKIANKNGIDKIYYVKMWDEVGNELYRDRYDVAEDIVFSVQEGDAVYYEMLEKLDSVLSEYVINGNSVGEKRIYLPLFVHLTNGIPDRAVTGIGEKQESSNDELTEEIIQDQEKIFNDFFKEKSCDKEC